jgi:hypothetical protein
MNKITKLFPINSNLIGYGTHRDINVPKIPGFTQQRLPWIYDTL